MRSTFPLFSLYDDALRANSAHNLVYLNNPKAGCSSIKRALWCAIQNRSPDTIKSAHELAGSPFQARPKDLAWLQNCFVFSFVRNPFSRIVSAYLNKIVGRKDMTWKRFAAVYRLDREAQISFDRFIDIISTDDAVGLNSHWRPQYLNLCYPLITPNVVGYLEHMDTQLPVVLARALGRKDVPLANMRAHGTGAQDKYRPFFENVETRAKVLALYDKDFEYFGYDRDPNADLAPLKVVPEYVGAHKTWVRVLEYRSVHFPRRRAEFLDLHLSSMGGGIYADWVAAEREKVERSPLRLLGL